jgi:hypothetical protein
MTQRVDLVIIYVSQECITSIIRVTRIGELRTMIAETINRRMLRRGVLRLLVTGNVPSSPIFVTLMMEWDTFLRNVGHSKRHAV